MKSGNRLINIWWSKKIFIPLGNHLCINCVLVVRNNMKIVLSIFTFIVFTLSSFSQSIVSINPSSSEINKTLTVGISGRCTNFFQTSSTSSIFWLANGTNSISSSSVNASSNTFMTGTITVPASATLGFWDLYVYNPIDDTLKLDTAFEVYDCNVTPPTIVSVSPKSSATGNNLTVSISGRCTHFYQTSSTSSIFWLANGTDVISPTSVNASNDTYLYGNVAVPSSATLGFWDMYVYNNVDDTIKLASAFEIYDCNTTAPSIVSISPNGSPTSNNLTVSISGRCTNFYQTSSTSSIFWLAKGGNTITPSSINASSNTQMSGGISVPSSAPLGWWDVYVYNNVDDTLILPGSFEVYYCTPTGISEINRTNNMPVNIYPNPFNSTTTFEFANPDAKQLTLFVYNIFGQLVKTIDKISSDKIMLNRENLGNGIFIYKLKNSEGTISTGKLIIAN